MVTDKNWDHASYSWYMALFFNSKHHCWRILPAYKKEKDLDRDCWRIVPATVEESCQWLLKSRASDCWIIVPATVEYSCQRQLKNRASHCCIIVPVTVEQSCQWLLKNHASHFLTIVLVTVEALCQWLLNNRASDSSTSKCPCNNVCSEIPFRVSSCYTNSSQLVTIRDILAGFSVTRFLLKCIYEQTVVYVRDCFSIEPYALQKPVNLQCKWIESFLYRASFYWKVFSKKHCGLFVNTFQ